MQRLFSAFPDGSPGVGLLLLRIAVGLLAAAEGALQLVNASHATLTTWCIGGLAIASAAALLIGFLTPGAGVALAVSIALLWVGVPSTGLFLDRIAAILLVADATAIALLGPGAFSLDARLFGRREILVPHDSRSPKS